MPNDMMDDIIYHEVLHVQHTVLAARTAYRDVYSTTHKAGVRDSPSDCSVQRHNSPRSYETRTEFWTALQPAPNSKHPRGPIIGQ